VSKFVFVTGGVVSSLGKGITVASLGRLLKSRGLKVSVLKFDPYLNVDPRTMSPFQHGEVFVTEDGGETDLDLGHYERFIDTNLSKDSNVTSGKIYYSILTRERKGGYRGGTVQVIPHVTNEIKDRIWSLAKSSEADVILVEIGGTVGDIEGLPFLEAIRQFRMDVGRESSLFIHVTLIPYMAAAQELKTKPTQHSVKELRSIGIQPDVIVCRSEAHLTDDIQAKVALFCNVEEKAVIPNPDVESIYEVPLCFAEAGLDEIVLEKLNLTAPEADLTVWRDLVSRIKDLSRKVVVGIVGKYVSLPDSYLSVAESLRHAGLHHGVEVEVRWIEAEDLEQGKLDILQDLDGILVPGGFGVRGVEGKIKAAQYARENKVPYFGICLGMQCAVIEFARNVAELKDAGSVEFGHCPHPVISFIPGQPEITGLEGPMRVGTYSCQIHPDTHSMRCYQQGEVKERHRNRYTVNNQYVERLSEAGMRVAGSTEDGVVEIVELEDHPWFVGTLFHPEFKSRPTRPHPLFVGFMQAILDRSQK
jgi:CTP synthase